MFKVPKGLVGMWKVSWTGKQETQLLVLAVTSSLKDDLAFLPTFCMRDIHFHFSIGMIPMALQMEWLKHLGKKLGGKEISPIFIPKSLCWKE